MGEEDRKKMDSSKCFSVYKKEVETSFLDTAKNHGFRYTTVCKTKVFVITKHVKVFKTGIFSKTMVFF